jgi:aconitate hydratase
MGIQPLQFVDSQNTESLGLTGKEKFNIPLSNGDLKVGQLLHVQADNKTFTVKVRLDTAVELLNFQNGGILHTVLKKLAAQK